ncbi:hypothetical protein H5410_036099 [Solanum commersonii]|uniref:Uncharacterized protein n=1 Tax=Solanum commersonii TaxID=4109 RepID=A0A9J5Y2K9_SOLCO|nr:hypothetical protein H5410_036099 [Solanum commersonii]
MGDAIKLSKTRTEENERRRNSVVNEDQVADVELVDDSKDKEDSEIVSIDVVAAVERRIMQKQITKRKREESSPKPVNASDPVFDKGPGSIGKNKKVDKLFSQEERVEIVRSQ